MEMACSRFRRNGGLDVSGVAVVSAAASGIGAATVTLLLSKGWRVVGVDVDAEGLGAVVPTWSVVGDARDLSTWHRVQEIVHEVGDGPRLALVTGVGRAVFTPSWEMDDDDWRGMFDLNVMTAVRALRVLLPDLKAAASASFVTVGSISGRRSEPTTPAYCTMKAALEAWTSVVALELASTKIRVNCVLPGVTDTEGLRGNLARKGEGLAEFSDRAGLQPRGTLLESAEIAAVIAFLVSEDASGLLASSVVVDGGLSRRLPG